MKWHSSTMIVAAGFAVTAAADVCNHDNLLRCLIRSASAAGPYCSGVISIPTTTVTVSTVTPTAIATIIGSVTITPSTAEIVVLTTTFTPSATDIESTTTTTTVVSTTLPTQLRRTAISSPFPNCLTDGTSFPASRISSACSCLTLPPSVTKVTATAPVVTVTTSQTVTSSAATENILTSTTDVITTGTVTSTTTAITVIETTIPIECDVHGYGNANYDIMQYDGSTADFNTCKGYCLSNPACLSFGFGLTTCALYNQQVSAHVLVIDSSPYAFYDLECTSAGAKKVRGLENRKGPQIRKDIDGNDIA